MKKVEVGKDAAIEAEVKAARERAVVPVDIRMKQFRDMLAEKEVSPTDFTILINLLMDCENESNHLRWLGDLP